MNAVVIDGSMGEGGGQIVRTALGLGIALGKAVQVVNIRAKRRNPGLRPQHLAAIRILSSLCDGRVENLGVGSTEFTFIPGPIDLRPINFDIGSAGSITLLLQAIIPAVALCKEPLDLRIVGGTDVNWSPTSEYFRHVVVPAFRSIGLAVEMNVVRRGYYPKGGGEVEVRISPTSAIHCLETHDPEFNSVISVSICSELSISIAERQQIAAEEILSKNGIDIRNQTRVEPAISPGTSIAICSYEGHGPFIGADSIGERGKTAEKVGTEAALDFLSEKRSKASVDSHLGDMLIPLLSLSSEESRFSVSKVTDHLTTNLRLASTLTGVIYKIEEAEGQPPFVSMKPRRG